MTQEREILMSSLEEYQSEARDLGQGQHNTDHHPALSGLLLRSHKQEHTLVPTSFQPSLYNIVVGVVEHWILGSNIRPHVIGKGRSENRNTNSEYLFHLPM